MTELDIKWTTGVRKIADLKEWAKNPRKISGEDYDKLKLDIQKFGFHDVLKIDTDGTILSGHQRRRVLMELGIVEVYVLFPDRPLTEAEREVVAVASNVHRGEFDFDIMANQFEFDNLVVAGMDPKDLSVFDLEEDDFNEQEELEKITEPKIKLGEVWTLGRHRLMCGDSTHLDDVEKLMAEQKARMLFTDPPYGVNYVENIVKGEKQKTTKHKDVLNDDLKADKLKGFLLLAFHNAFLWMTDDATFYSWFANSTYIEFRQAMEAAGFRYAQVIVWIKSHFVLSRSDYHHMYEPCMYGWKADKKHFSNHNMRSFDDVLSVEKDAFADHVDTWFVARDKLSEYAHPTQKPVRLAERALKMSTVAGDIVLDLFVGGGMSLIAAEQSGRRCFGMELDPRYVELCIKRWAKFTGQDPVREDGVLWSEINK